MSNLNEELSIKLIGKLTIFLPSIENDYNKQRKSIIWIVRFNSMQNKWNY